MAWTCPLCNETNKDDIQRCFCGQEYGQMANAHGVTETSSVGINGIVSETRSRKTLHTVDVAAQEEARKDMIVGGLWFTGGILITGLTYLVARQKGGIYVVTSGAIIYGAIQFLRGLYRQ
jgi:hypothetical protein